MGIWGIEHQREGFALPEVSIITPLYNASENMDETIESVLAQTFQDWEMLLIDNMSKDDSLSKARSWAEKDARIRVLECTHKQGAAVTRNTGIEAATGRYIAFLDSDDIWLPKKLEAQIPFMKDCDVVFSWTSYAVFGGKKEFVRETAIRSSSWDLLTKKAVIGCLTGVYDTKAFGKVYMEDIPQREDFVLFYQLLKTAEDKGWKCRGVYEVLARYRQQSVSLSSNKSKAAGHQWRAYRDTLSLSLPVALWCFGWYAWRGVSERLFV